jgi:hypothetical protein
MEQEEKIAQASLLKFLRRNSMFPCHQSCASDSNPLLLTKIPCYQAPLFRYFYWSLTLLLSTTVIPAPLGRICYQPCSIPVPVITCNYIAWLSCDLFTRPSKFISESAKRVTLDRQQCASMLITHSHHFNLANLPWVCNRPGGRTAVSVIVVLRRFADAHLTYTSV